MAGVSIGIDGLQRREGFVGPCHRLPMEHRRLPGAASFQRVDPAAGKWPDVVDAAGHILQEKRTGGRPAFFAPPGIPVDGVLQGGPLGPWQLPEVLPNPQSFQGGDVDAAGIRAAEGAAFGACGRLPELRCLGRMQIVDLRECIQCGCHVLRFTAQGP